MKKSFLRQRLLAWSCCLLPLWGSVWIQPASALELRYAENFTVEARDGYHLLTVRRAYQGSDGREFHYALYPRGTARPKVAEKAWLVEVPLRRSVVLVTTTLASIEVLGALDSVVAVGNFDHISSAAVRERIAAGKLREVGSEQAKNLEKMVAVDPEVIFTNLVGVPEYDLHPTLAGMGIVPVITAAYMETHALGRLEWLKFFAYFFDAHEEAAGHFERVEARYLALKELAASVEKRPRVFANAPWGNAWYISSGTSFLANLIADAGGDYCWRELQSEGPRPMDFESVYSVVVDADVWVNSGSLETRAAIRAQDRRYLDFRAVREGRVFSETRRLGPGGGNDLWESGFVWPDKVLADFVAMFHPGLMAEHEWTYYKVID
jgi:iron complex transport system substrate-binding protein